MNNVLIASTLIALSSLTACSGPGRCVGAAGALAAGQNAKVLLNLDSDAIAIQGYDPVAFFTNAKPVKGDPAFRSVYRGATYQFTSAEHKKLFDASPAKYEPQFGGYCAYAASIDTISPIDPTFFEIVDGRLLLQHNKRAWDKWHEDAKENLVKADRNWPGLVDREGNPPRLLINIDERGLAMEGYDPVSYFTDGKPIKGDNSIARSFQGATYHFANVEHKNLFERDPSKYVPQYGGFCGYAASIDKVSPANPQIWQLVDGRLVLQHTPEAFRLFNQDLAANDAKARKYWPGLSHRRCEN
ncbi:MAG: YHS domain-containing (seleno)protein [Planctomycetota bacterium]